ncbi:hypothetical protein HQ314_05605 [Rhodococcus sp. BP-332]|uniref:hypothetical protein n=1 Tax=Rhodococcus sp. BP-332 TaxID=2739447 RepID=UPI001C9AEE69|nr:hypothetical protein [Rhodococcus sp. BP-332]MBY6676387.1 hypothetical protein [Rhodococcus sp. BP-332]
MITESRRQLIESGSDTAPGILATSMMGTVFVTTRDLLDTEIDADALADELVATYEHRRPASSPAATCDATSDGSPRPRPATSLGKTWLVVTEILVEHEVAPSYELARWPGPLQDWYPADALSEPSVRFWFEQGCWRYPDLLPTPRPVGPASSVELSQLWERIEGDFDHDDDDSEGDDTAGEWAVGYDRRLVVIADLDGVSLVIDTRPGPRRGCISEFSGGFLNPESVRWAGLNEFLDDIRTALAGDTRFANRWSVQFDAGQLTWNLANPAT